MWCDGLTVALDLLRKTQGRRGGTGRRRAAARSSRKLEHRLRGVMKTARRASNVEVPSFLRQLVKETEKMVTFFFKGGPKETGCGEEDNLDEDDSMQSPYLDRPNLEKHVSEGGSQLGVNYAVASMQGWRAQMEDAHTCMPQLREELTDWAYYAVFDGHAGNGVAQYCSRNLLDYILATGTEQLVTGWINLIFKLVQFSYLRVTHFQIVMICSSKFQRSLNALAIVGLNHRI